MEKESNCGNCRHWNNRTREFQDFPAWGRCENTKSPDDFKSLCDNSWNCSSWKEKIIPTETSSKPSDLSFLKIIPSEKSSKMGVYASYSKNPNRIMALRNLAKHYYWRGMFSQFREISNMANNMESGIS